MNEYTGGAIWLSTKKKDLKPGQKVQYQIRGGIDESYPAQAEAKDIKIIKEGKEWTTQYALQNYRLQKKLKY